MAMVPPICDIHVVREGNCNNNNTRDPKSIIMIYDCLGYIIYNYFFYSYKSKVYVVSMKPKPQNDGFVNPII